MIPQRPIPVRVLAILTDPIRLFSDGKFIDPSTLLSGRPRLSGQISYTRSLSWLPWGGGKGGAKLGSIDLENADGAITDLLYAGLRDERFEIRIGVLGQALSAMRLAAVGTIEKVDGISEHTIRISVADLASRLDIPMQPRVFDSPAPDNIVGRPIPIPVGRPLQCPLPLVDPVLLDFQSSDRASEGAVLVRDRGVILDKGTSWIDSPAVEGVRHIVGGLDFPRLITADLHGVLRSTAAVVSDSVGDFAGATWAGSPLRPPGWIGATSGLVAITQVAAAAPSEVDFIDATEGDFVAAVWAGSPANPPGWVGVRSGSTITEVAEGAKLATLGGSGQRVCALIWDAPTLTAGKRYTVTLIAHSATGTFSVREGRAVGAPVIVAGSAAGVFEAEFTAQTSEKLEIRLEGFPGIEAVIESIRVIELVPATAPGARFFADDTGPTASLTLDAVNPVAANIAHRVDIDVTRSGGTLTLTVGDTTTAITATGVYRLLLQPGTLGDVVLSTANIVDVTVSSITVSAVRLIETLPDIVWLICVAPYLDQDGVMQDGPLDTSEIDWDSVNALQTLTQYRADAFISNARTRGEWLTDFLDSYGASWWPETDGLLTVGRPGRPADVGLVIEDHMLAAEISIVQDTAPGLTDTVRAARNWRTLEGSDIADSIEPAEAANLAAEYRISRKSEITIHPDYAHARTSPGAARPGADDDRAGLGTLLRESFDAKSLADHYAGAYAAKKYIATVPIELDAAAAEALPLIEGVRFNLSEGRDIWNLTSTTQRWMLREISGDLGNQRVTLKLWGPFDDPE